MSTGAAKDSAPFAYQWGTPTAVSDCVPERSYAFTINNRTACCVDLSSCKDCVGAQGRAVGFCHLDEHGRVQKAMYSWLGVQQVAKNESAWVLYMTPSGQHFCDLCSQLTISFSKRLEALCRQGAPLHVGLPVSMVYAKLHMVISA